MSLMETTTPWNFVAPTAPLVRSYDVSDFLSEAPVGTVIDVDGDLYKRLTGDQWLELENVVTGFSGMAGAYAEHETVSYWNLSEQVNAADYEVRVLRLGETF